MINTWTSSCKKWLFWTWSVRQHSCLSCTMFQELSFLFVTLRWFCCHCFNSFTSCWCHQTRNEHIYIHIFQHLMLSLLHFLLNMGLNWYGSQCILFLFTFTYSVWTFLEGGLNVLWQFLSNETIGQWINDLLLKHIFWLSNIVFLHTHRKHSVFFHFSPNVHSHLRFSSDTAAPVICKPALSPDHLKQAAVWDELSCLFWENKWAFHLSF